MCNEYCIFYLINRERSLISSSKKKMRVIIKVCFIHANNKVYILLDTEFSSVKISSKVETVEETHDEVFSQPTAERTIDLQHCHLLPLHSETWYLEIL